MAFQKNLTPISPVCISNRYRFSVCWPHHTWRYCHAFFSLGAKATTLDALFFVANPAPYFSSAQCAADFGPASMAHDSVRRSTVSIGRQIVLLPPARSYTGLTTAGGEQPLLFPYHALRRGDKTYYNNTLCVFVSTPSQTHRLIVFNDRFRVIDLYNPLSLAFNRH